MNVHADASQLGTMKFAIGQPVTRKEDPTLLRGQGRYTDDISLPNQAYCVMVRSQVAHGIIKGIDIEEARLLLMLPEHKLNFHTDTPQNT